jgi:dGTPase
VGVVVEAARVRHRLLKRILAGMTDRFAISRHREIVGPVELPDHF